MAEFYDLIRLAQTDAGGFRKLLADERKLAQFNLTSAQLEAVKAMDPAHVRTVVEGIEERLRVGAVPGTNACPGTFACFEG